ncbi:MAG TPA: hypothetical protein DCR78_19545 [Pseudomonas sp.]|uniref:Uncharacterized protein n=1 Tax=Stutzerimonas zhaodongensis TaxID=1176257 RepID=A0A365PV70_9GAMM|nr:hypothetical protein [Stutzerimonas stutzeri]MBK3845085.1 hypothetical protein [Stutzerimonas xanthomarina]MBU0563347.1 hypothetical protein [Gammaproteobacteria bacterium]QWV19178.1 hypothetical protein KQ248_01070 [Stutzerimonas zhaodongensis]HAB63951.1 hypothetical protein [Pseudomonas sp.]
MAWATLRCQLCETFSVKFSSTLLMRLFKAHARWRWRA